MPRVLERTHPLQRDRPTDVDIGRRDVDPELDAQRAAERELLLEPARREQVDVVAGEGVDVAHGAGDSTGGPVERDRNVRCREDREPAETGERRDAARDHQRHPRPERRHEGSACGERDELGGVAQAVVGRKGATVAVLGDAMVDERAEGDVLDPVPIAADEVADDHEPEDEPERREGLAEPLHRDRGEAGGRERGHGDPRREVVRREHHPDRPARQHDPDADVLDAEHVLDVDEVGRDRRRHEDERDRRDGHRQREQPVLEQEGEPVARPPALTCGRLRVTSHRQGRARRRRRRGSSRRRRASRARRRRP